MKYSDRPIGSYVLDYQEAHMTFRNIVVWQIYSKSKDRIELLDLLSLKSEFGNVGKDTEYPKDNYFLGKDSSFLLKTYYEIQ